MNKEDKSCGFVITVVAVMVGNIWFVVRRLRCVKLCHCFIGSSTSHASCLCFQHVIPEAISICLKGLLFGYVLSIV